MRNLVRTSLTVMGLLLCSSIVTDAGPPEVAAAVSRSIYRGLPAPPDCGHLYNVGKHREWAACMGVGYD